MSPAECALCGALVLALVWLVWLLGAPAHPGRREKFVSARAQQVYAASTQAFEASGGLLSFSEYRLAVPDADAVLYTDARDLWRRHQLTPEWVEKLL